LIPPKVNVVDENKFNFLLIGNITWLKATAISLSAILRFLSLSFRVKFLVQHSFAMIVTFNYKIY